MVRVHIVGMGRSGLGESQQHANGYYMFLKEVSDVQARTLDNYFESMSPVLREADRHHVPLDHITREVQQRREEALDLRVIEGLLDAYFVEAGTIRKQSDRVFPEYDVTRYDELQENNWRKAIEDRIEDIGQTELEDYE